MRSVVQSSSSPPFHSTEASLPGAARFALVARQGLIVNRDEPFPFSVRTARLAVTPHLIVGHAADGLPVLEVTVNCALFDRLKRLARSEVTIPQLLPILAHLIPTERDLQPSEGRLLHLFHRNYRYSPAVSSDRLRPHLEMAYLLRRCRAFADSVISDSYGLAAHLLVQCGNESVRFQREGFIVPRSDAAFLAVRAHDLSPAMRTQACREQRLFQKIIERHELGYPTAGIKRSLGVDIDKRTIGRWITNGCTGANEWLKMYGERRREREERFDVAIRSPRAAYALGSLCGGLQGNDTAGRKRINFCFPKANTAFIRGLTDLLGRNVVVRLVPRSDGMLHIVDEVPAVAVINALTDSGRLVPLSLLSSRTEREALVAGFMEHKKGLKEGSYTASFTHHRKKAAQFGLTLTKLGIGASMRSSTTTAIVVTDPKDLAYLAAIRKAPWSGDQGFAAVSDKFHSHRSEHRSADSFRRRLLVQERRLKLLELTPAQRAVAEGRNEVAGATSSSLTEIPLRAVSSALKLQLDSPEQCVSAVIERYYERIRRMASALLREYRAPPHLETDDMIQEVALRTSEILSSWLPTKGPLPDYFMLRARGTILTAIIRALPVGQTPVRVAKALASADANGLDVAAVVSMFGVEDSTARNALALARGGLKRRAPKLEAIAPDAVTAAEEVSNFDVSRLTPTERAAVLLRASGAPIDRAARQSGVSARRIESLVEEVAKRH